MIGLSSFPLSFCSHNWPSHTGHQPTQLFICFPPCRNYCHLTHRKMQERSSSPLHFEAQREPTSTISNFMQFFWDLGAIPYCTPQRDRHFVLPRCSTHHQDCPWVLPPGEMPHLWECWIWQPCWNLALHQERAWVLSYFILRIRVQPHHHRSQNCQGWVFWIPE